jgi:nucleoid-associated protein Lsr2
MATRTSVVLEDDLTGEPADTTVKFGLSGTDYEIDLTDKNAEEMREAFSRYITAARKVGGGRSVQQSRAATRSGSDYDPAAVRAWANSKGIEVNARGRIKSDIVEQFKAAGN